GRPVHAKDVAQRHRGLGKGGFRSGRGRGVNAHASPPLPTTDDARTQLATPATPSAATASKAISPQGATVTSGGWGAPSVVAVWTAATASRVRIAASTNPA